MKAPTTVLFALVALVLGMPTTNVLGQYDDEADFGPAPGGYRTIYDNLPLESRYERAPYSRRSPLPARGHDLEYSNSRVPVRPGDWDLASRPVSRRPSEYRPGDDRPTYSRPILRDRDDQLQAEERYRPTRPTDDEWNTAPLAPRPRTPRMPRDLLPKKDQSPAPSAVLTPEQKLQKRYRDPRVTRLLQAASETQTDQFYQETADLIDRRHIEPTSYDKRTDVALSNLATAINVKEFRQATGLQSNTIAAREFVSGLERLQDQQVRSRQEAIRVMQQTKQLAAQTVGLPPTVVGLEFVYAALDTLDQYSSFLPPEKGGSANLGLKSDVVGIGVEIETAPEGLKILKAISGGPAAQATLRRGDLITAIDGQSIAGLELTAAVDLIAGQEGSKVRLELKRDDMVGDVSLTRRRIVIKAVPEAKILSNSDGVAYIKLDQFSESAIQEIDRALAALNQQGMQSLIMDVRGNPGGLLTAAIALSDRFLPSGTIVSTRGRTDADNSSELAERGQTWKMPLVVMIDHNSASASEIFAAAIQENGRGLVVGERSYGKGTVQTLFPLQTLSGALKLTTAKFYSPDGREMAGKGVTPDVPAPAPKNDTSGADFALEVALRTTRDRRLEDMAGRFERTGENDIKVFKIVGAGTEDHVIR